MDCHKRLSTNKTFEVQLSYFGFEHIFSFEIALNWTFKQDHAGPSFRLTIFGLDFNISVNDNRHWDYDNNCWSVS
jgi:hypothetical protein